MRILLSLTILLCLVGMSCDDDDDDDDEPIDIVIKDWPRMWLVCRPRFFDNNKIE